MQEIGKSHVEHQARHFADRSIVREITPKVNAMLVELSKVVIGQQDMLTKLITAMLSNGHVLLEGMPGLAKTTAIKSLANCVDTQFRRVQFTPDLLPADLVGTLIYNPATASFSTRKGPIFTNFLLADEINRAPSKVQSALLEAMEERQVTIGDATYPLSDLFLVLATQNPLEQEGTYPLPEAQVDRFMFKLKVGYPSEADERSVLDQSLDQKKSVCQAVVSPDDVRSMRAAAASIYIDPKVRNYILNLVRATREPARFKLKDLVQMIQFGASPRRRFGWRMAAEHWHSCAVEPMSRLKMSRIWRPMFFASPGADL